MKSVNIHTRSMNNQTVILKHALSGLQYKRQHDGLNTWHKQQVTNRRINESVFARVQNIVTVDWPVSLLESRIVLEDDRNLVFLNKYPSRN